MRIALDYDDTITLDHAGWMVFIQLFKERGHIVKIVTIRGENGINDDIIRYAKTADVDVIFTNGNQKRPYCKQLGFFVDVFIDDAPEIIPEGDLLYTTFEGCFYNSEVNLENLNPDQAIIKKLSNTANSP